MTTTTLSATPAQVLAALVNSTSPVGWGRSDPMANKTMTQGDAEEFLQGKRPYVDYVWGRPIKVNLSSLPSLDLRLYDRDAGVDVGATALMNAGLLADF